MNRPIYPCRRGGFTLVEMLVALAVSLIMILGIAQMFQLVGEGTAKGRASLQMADRLSEISHRLEADLSQLTVSPSPDVSRAVRDGFFTYVEGPLNDTTATVAAGESLLGDVDDVISMTVRTSGEPFSGLILGRTFPVTFVNNPSPSIPSIPATFTPPPVGTPVTHYWVLPPTNADQYATIYSDVAEIVWWTTLDDRNFNGLRDAGEFYKLHRRVFLVVPNLIFHPSFFSRLRPAQFRNVMDVSVKVGTVAGVNTWLSNSLADLSQRQNRFGHSDTPIPIVPFRLIPAGAPNRNYPGAHPAFADPPYTPSPFLPSDPALHNFTSLVAQFDATDLDGATTTPSAITLNTVEINYGSTTLPGNVAVQHRMLKRGEDVILANVAGFDVRAYDPRAAILASVSGADATNVSPGDPGFDTLLGSGAPVVGRGAYVDLFYARGLANSLAAHPQGSLVSDFSSITQFEFLAGNLIPPAQRIMPTAAYPAVYDSWMFTPDFGADGIDNNNNGLIDELIEQGAPPPYTVPLKGLQIQLRVYDDSTRQIRQVTVTQNL